MNGLVLAAAFDSGGKHPSDATSVFRPGAIAFAKKHGLAAPLFFDNRAMPIRARLGPVLSMIRKAPKPLDVLAIMSHGWHDGAQWGVDLAHVEEVADVIKEVAADKITIALYECSTGEDKSEIGRKGFHMSAPGAGNGGLADTLRDALLAWKLTPRVVAHACEGHALFNPYVRVFDATTDNGGAWLVDPGDAEFSAWDHALHHSDLWARMPLMERASILAELG